MTMYWAVKNRMAGTAAALMISMYGIPVISTMMKAPAPMTGGASWPPVEDAASTAPATSRRKPDRRIIGIVKTPLLTVFATELPLMVPEKALASTATLAVP